MPEHFTVPETALIGAPPCFFEEFKRRWQLNEEQMRRNLDADVTSLAKLEHDKTERFMLLREIVVKLSREMLSSAELVQLIEAARIVAKSEALGRGQ